MHIDVLTLFPQMFDGVLSESILGRAQQSGKLCVRTHDIRAWAQNKHHRVDDYAFGGGTGLVMMPQPIFSAIGAVDPSHEARRIYLSAQGKPLTDQKVRALAGCTRLLLLCGHYEGVDQRAIDALIDEEICIGDYVLTGGELPAMVLIDAVARQIPGVLGNEQGAQEESFADGLLEYPQYTRPACYEGLCVPDVLLSGHHANIVKWRREKMLERTYRMRPDLLARAPLTPQERQLVRQWEKEQDD